MRALLDEAHAAGLRIDVPAAVLAHAWRAGPRQARLARTLQLPNVPVPGGLLKTAAHPAGGGAVVVA